MAEIRRISQRRYEFLRQQAAPELDRDQYFLGQSNGISLPYSSLQRNSGK